MFCGQVTRVHISACSMENEGVEFCNVQKDNTETSLNKGVSVQLVFVMLIVRSERKTKAGRSQTSNPFAELACLQLKFHLKKKLQQTCSVV